MAQKKTAKHYRQTRGGGRRCEEYSQQMYFHSAQATPTVSDSQRLKNTHFWLPARTDEKTPGEEGRTAQRKRKKKKKGSNVHCVFRSKAILRSSILTFLNFVQPNTKSPRPPFFLSALFCSFPQHKFRASTTAYLRESYVAYGHYGNK